MMLLSHLLLPLLAFVPIDEVRAIEAHLLIHNEKAALARARRCLIDYPDEPLSYELLVRSLAACQRDGEMVKLWVEFAAQFPDEAQQQEILEQMCWGILRKGRESHQSATRLLALIGAALTQDRYAVEFINEGLHSSNLQMRALSVQLGALFRDHELREGIEELLSNEQNADVRVEVMRACGVLKDPKLVPVLMELLRSKRGGAAEKREAIRAVLEIA